MNPVVPSQSKSSTTRSEDDRAIALSQELKVITEETRASFQQAWDQTNLNMSKLIDFSILLADSQAQALEVNRISSDIGQLKEQINSLTKDFSDMLIRIKNSRNEIAKSLASTSQCKNEIACDSGDSQTKSEWQYNTWMSSLGCLSESF